jgi:hypothetical protein
LRLPAEQKKAPSLLPLGKRGFYRGTIKNAEKTVTLLGCNYMVQGSVEQAIGIIERRYEASKQDLKNIEDALLRRPEIRAPAAQEKGSTKKEGFSKGFLEQKKKAGGNKNGKETQLATLEKVESQQKKTLSMKDKTLVETLLPAEKAQEREDFIKQMMASIAAKNAPQDKEDAGCSGGGMYAKRNLEGKILEIDGEKIYEIFEEMTEEKAQKEKEARSKLQEEAIEKRLENKGKKKSGFRLYGMEERQRREKEEEDLSRHKVKHKTLIADDPLLARLQALEAEENGITKETEKPSVKQAFSGLVTQREPGNPTLGMCVCVGERENLTFSKTAAAFPH